jgi:hypothetical protein
LTATPVDDGSVVVSIPVARRWIPESSTIGVAAWLAACPVAFLAATALVPGQRILVTALAITSMLGAKALATAGSARDRRRGLAASWLLIAVAVAAISHEIAAAAGFHAHVVACALGALAGGLYVRAIAVARPSAHEALDARALALEPVATWLAVSAVLVRFGSEAVHFHLAGPTLAVLAAAIGLLSGIAASALLALQLRWTHRLYRDQLRPLRLAAPPAAADAATAFPVLSAGLDADAAVALRAAGTVAPYRTRAAGATIALVPSRPEKLLGRYRGRTMAALLALAVAAASIVLVARSGAERAHGSARVGLAQEFPGPGPAAVPGVSFIALEPLTLLDLEAVAARYRRLGLRARVGPPLAAYRSTFDHQRRQLVAEDVISLAREVTPRTDRDLVLVITEQDMYLRARNWRYAFAAREDRFAVISLARMDPAFPWRAGVSYVATAAACNVELQTRAYKMMTRQIAFAGLGAVTSDDPRSVRRSILLSRAELDRIDESVW